MLRIYGVPISVHTRKVIVVALAKGLDFEVIPVVPVIPGNPPANWRELSPTGKIPALVDGDFTVADSAAICAYLEKIHPAAPVYPSAPREYATALALEQYAGALFRDVVHPLFQETFVFPRIQQVATNQKRVDKVLGENVPEMFGFLDAAIRGDYLAGDRATVADFAVVSNLITYQYIGFDLFRARFRRVAALFDRVISHAAMAEAMRREQPVVDSMALKRDWHVQDR
jgi:glutathione S-transferase